MKRNLITFTAPAGIYFFGDPCYAIDDDKLWTEVCDALYSGQDEGAASGTLSNGTFFAACNTHFGDGSYRGSDGYEYGVDAGLLGVVALKPEEVETVRKRDLGTIRTMVTPFTVTTDPNTGDITLGDVYIQTGWHHDEEEEEEE